MPRLIAATLFAVILTSCAGIDVGRVSDDNQKDVGGIRYYQSAPFLLVYSDGKGGINHEILFLPDLSKEMYARPYGWFAKSDVELKFKNGIIDSGTSTGDGTALPKAIIAALKSVELARLAAGDEIDGTGVATFPSPELYRIEVTESGSIELHGGYAFEATGSESQVRVPLRPAAPAKKNGAKK